jgi:tetratricopeptide (TPR) repeat protein
VKIKTLYLHCFLALVPLVPLHAQSRAIDSLKKNLQVSNIDTGRINTLIALCNEFRIKNMTDESLGYGREALRTAQDLTWQRGIAKAENALGAVFYTRGDYAKSLDLFIKALEIEIRLGDKPASARHQNNIGVIYRNKSNYSKSLEYFFMALKTGEELKEKTIISTSCGNIGNVYNDQKDYGKALDYYNRALRISKELDDKNSIARHLGNIGTVYNRQHNYQKALACFLEVLQMAEGLGYSQLKGNMLANIGNVYNLIGDSLRRSGNMKGANEQYELALGQYKQAREIAEKAGSRSEVSMQMGYMAHIYLMEKKFPQAIDYFKKALALSIAARTPRLQVDQYRELSELYSLTGDHPRAFETYKKYVMAKDSVVNEENTKKQTQAEMQYTFDKQQTADSTRNAEQVKQENLKHDQEIQQQKLYTYGGALGFLLMLIVAGVSFNAYRQKQKANALISEQKLLVEQKQKEVLDSIQYAKRIQVSLLPTEFYIGRSITRLHKK